MPRQITRSREELIADFLDLDQCFCALAEKCTRDQLAWHPGGGSWSIAQCMHHVALANSQYLGPIRVAIEANRSSEQSPVTTLSTAGWFSSYFVAKIGPERRTRWKAPKKIRPFGVLPDQVLESLLATHREIRDLLASPSLPDLNRIRFKNPFVSGIRFTVATGFLVMAAHGRRHLLQAEGIHNSEGFSRLRAIARR
jgi:hypothetical protein